MGLWEAVVGRGRLTVKLLPPSRGRGTYSNWWSHGGPFCKPRNQTMTWYTMVIMTILYGQLNVRYRPMNSWKLLSTKFTCHTMLTHQLILMNCTMMKKCFGMHYMMSVGNSVNKIWPIKNQWMCYNWFYPTWASLIAQQWLSVKDIIEFYDINEL